MRLRIGHRLSFWGCWAARAAVAAWSLAGAAALGYVVSIPPLPNIVPETFDQFHIDRVPDFTGDALADLVVAVQAVLGRPPLVIDIYAVDSATGAVVGAFQVPNSYEGLSVVGIADLNGDGKGDVLTGRDLADYKWVARSMPAGLVIGRFDIANPERTLDFTGDGRPEVWSSYCYPGQGFTQCFQDLFDLTNPEQALASGVGSVPDVNADGIPDLYEVTSWPPGGPPPVARMISGADFTTALREGPPIAGRMAFGLPDVTGDGAGDMLFSLSDGSMRVVSGASWEPGATIANPAPAVGDGWGSSTVQTEGDGHALQWVETAGPRVAVTVPRYEGDLEGRIHVFDPATGELLRTLGPTHLRRTSFGAQAVALDDMTGDGTPELAVAAGESASRRPLIEVIDGATGATLPGPGLPPALELPPCPVADRNWDGAIDARDVVTELLQP